MKRLLFFLFTLLFISTNVFFNPFFVVMVSANSDSIPTSIEVSGYPSIVSRIGEGVNTSYFYAMLRDQYGNIMENQPVTWSVESTLTGVSINQSGQLTVPETSQNTVIRIQAVLNSDSQVVGSREIQVYSTAIDDHPNTYSGAVSSTGTQAAINGVLNYPGDVDWFSFTPSESGFYGIGTSGNLDTIGDLYDSNGTTHLKYNNDPYSMNADLNFHFGYLLEAGKTYFIRVAQGYSYNGNYQNNLGSYTLNIAPETRVADSIYVQSINGSSSQSIPSNGTSRQVSFSAIVYDTYYNPIANTDVSWYLDSGDGQKVTSVTGAAIDPDSGVLTITSEMQPGNLWVHAYMGDLDGYDEISFSVAVPCSIDIDGDDQIRIPGGTSPIQKNYTASVYDTLGYEMPGEEVTWSVLQNISSSSVSMTGIGIDESSGTLTVTNGAQAGNITIMATSSKNGLVCGTYYVNLLPPVDDDYGDSYDNSYPVAALPAAINGKLNYGGDHDYFEFTPQETGRYIIKTAGNIDTYGTLYTLNNGEFQVVEFDDDDGDSTNFLLNMHLIGGQKYYLDVRGYDTYVIGNYELNIAKYDSVPSYISIDGPTTVAIPSSSSSLAKQYSAIVSDQNNVTLSGEPVIWSVEGSSVNGVSIDLNTGLLTITNQARPGIVTIKATAVSNTNVYAAIQVNLMEDDYPNDTYDINQLTDITSTVNGRINYAYDMDYFKFSVATSGVYEFSCSPEVKLNIFGSGSSYPEYYNGKYYIYLRSGSLYYIGIYGNSSAPYEYSFNAALDEREGHHITFTSKNYAFIPMGVNDTNGVKVNAELRDNNDNRLPGKPINYSVSQANGVSYYGGGEFYVYSQATPGAITIRASSAENPSIFSEQQFVLRSAAEIESISITAPDTLEIPQITGSSYSCIEMTAEIRDNSGLIVEDDMVWSLEGNTNSSVYMNSEGILEIYSYSVPGNITVKAASKSNPNVFSTKTIALRPVVQSNEVVFSVDINRNFGSFSARSAVVQNGSLNYADIGNKITTRSSSYGTNQNSTVMYTIRDLDWSNGKERYVFWIPTDRGLIKKEISQSDLGKYYYLDFDDTYVPLYIDSPVGMGTGNYQSCAYINLATDSFAAEVGSIYGLSNISNPYLMPAGTYDIQLALIEGTKFYDVLRNDFVISKSQTITNSSITVNPDDMVRISHEMDNKTGIAMNFSDMSVNIKDFYGTTMSSQYGVAEFYLEKGYYNSINIHYSDSQSNNINYRRESLDITTNTAIRLDNDFAFKFNSNISYYNLGQRIYAYDLFSIRDGQGNRVSLYDANYNEFQRKISYVNNESSTVSGIIILDEWGDFSLPQIPGQYTLTVEMLSNTLSVTSASAMVVLSGSVQPPPPEPGTSFVNIIAPAVVAIPTESSPSSIQLDVESPSNVGWSAEQITSGSGVQVSSGGAFYVSPTAEDQVVKVTATDSCSNVSVGEAYILVTDTDINTVKADINNDAEVKVNDLVIFAASYGKAAGDQSFDSRVDFNNDGKVNMVDFFLMKEASKTVSTPTPPPSTPTPAPSAPTQSGGAVVIAAEEESKSLEQDTTIVEEANDKIEIIVNCENQYGDNISEANISVETVTSTTESTSGNTTIIETPQ